MNKFDDQSKYYQGYLYMGYAWAVIVLIMLLLSSCYVYDSTYTTQQHNCELMARGDMCLSDHRCCNKQEHSTQIYYYNNLPYWGFYNDYYYYYGVAHMYPWWYYYTIRPHYTYNVSTHVYVTCNTGYYIGKPRGPKFSNNRGGTFKPINTKVVKNNRNNKANVNSPNTKQFNSDQYFNRTKTNVNNNRNNTKVKTNNTKVRTNKTNVKTNRTNIKTNTHKKSNNRVNTNKRNTKRPR